MMIQISPDEWINSRFIRLVRRTTNNNGTAVTFVGNEYKTIDDMPPEELVARLNDAASDEMANADT